MRAVCRVSGFDVYILRLPPRGVNPPGHLCQPSVPHGEPLELHKRCTRLRKISRSLAPASMRFAVPSPLICGSFVSLR
jgi:hypothetical protein